MGSVADRAVWDCDLVKRNFIVTPNSLTCPECDATPGMIAHRHHKTPDGSCGTKNVRTGVVCNCPVRINHPERTE